MRPEQILFPRPEGLYCGPGDFYIDPVRPVEKAVITHGHADHARAGHGRVLATAPTLAIMGVRYGAQFAGATQALGYGETQRVGDAQVRLAPAGHVLGSAQAVVEHGGVRIVVSGDYKRRADPTCVPFEPVACDVFVSEATFALPVFRHPDDRDEIAKLLASVSRNPERAHLVGAYSLGKAQRIIALLRAAGHDAPIYLHGAMEKLCALYSEHGVALGCLELVRPDLARQDMAGAIVLAPPSAMADRSGGLFRLRVDARAPAGQAARCGIAPDYL
jgi:putative mRNA 3-end processing factor